MYVVSAAAVYSSLSRNSVYCLCRVGLLSVNALHYLPKEITILPLEYYSLLDSGISATVARWLISPDCVQSHHGVVYCLCITSSAHSIFQQKNQSLDLEPNLFDFLIKKQFAAALFYYFCGPAIVQPTPSSVFLAGLSRPTSPSTRRALAR